LTDGRDLGIALHCLCPVVEVYAKLRGKMQRRVGCRARIDGFYAEFGKYYIEMWLALIRTSSAPFSRLFGVRNYQTSANTTASSEGERMDKLEAGNNHFCQFACT
jgi:hypothetical protein